MVYQIYINTTRRDVACYVSTKTSPKPQSLNPHPTVPSPPCSTHCHPDAGRISKRYQNKNLTNTKINAHNDTKSVKSHKSA